MSSNTFTYSQYLAFLTKLWLREGRSRSKQYKGSSIFVLFDFKTIPHIHLPYQIPQFRKKKKNWQIFRVIFYMNRTDSVSSLLTSNNVLNVYQNYNFQVCTTMHKAVNNDLPVSLHDQLTINNEFIPENPD